MTLALAAYRFGSNEASEAAHGWLEAINTAISRGPTDSSTFLLRLLLQATGTATQNLDVQLQYKLNSGSFTNVTTSSSVVKAVSTTIFSDAANTTSRLGGSGTFESSSAGASHDGLCGGNAFDIASSGNGECLYSIQLVPADIAPGDVITFKVLGEGVDLDGGYTVTPTINVAAYVSNPVNFDGTNDYLTRGAGLTGAADSKLWSGSFWFRRAAASGVLERITRNALGRVAIFINASNQLVLFGSGTTGTNILSATSTVAITDTNWHHFAYAVDMATIGNFRMYLDRVSVAPTPSPHTDALIDFTDTNWGVGAASDGSGNKFAGDLADFLFAPGQYIDWSVSTTLDKVILNNAPVDTGDNGILITGTAALVALRGVTDQWQVNKGTGGGFTENGALTDGTGPVEITGPVEGVGTASGVGTATGTGAPRISGAGTSAGTGTGTAAGRATAAGTGTAAGSGVAVGTGASISAAAGTAIGEGVAVGDGAAQFGWVGTASGVGTATGIGASTVAAVGSGAGTGAAAGVGLATATATGIAVGAGVGTGIGAPTAAVVGTAAGVGAATGTGAEQAASVGSSAGIGTAAAAGSPVVAATGLAAGAGDAAAVGASTNAGIGTAIGAGPAAGTGALSHAAAGSALGAGDAIGVGASLDTGAGTALGIGMASAVSTAAGLAAGDGTASGTGTGIAIGAEVCSVVGTAIGASAASAVARSINAGTGTAAGAGIANGAGAAICAAIGTAAAVGTATGIGAVITEVLEPIQPVKKYTIATKPRRFVISAERLHRTSRWPRAA